MSDEVLSFIMFWKRLAWNLILRDHAQNTTNPEISLVVNNVITLLIGRSKWAPISSIMYHLGEGTRPCPFPVTKNGHCQGYLAYLIHYRSSWAPYCWTNQNRDDVIDNQWNFRIGRILGMIPYSVGTLVPPYSSALFLLASSSHWTRASVYSRSPWIGSHIRKL